MAKPNRNMNRLFVTFVISACLSLACSDTGQTPQREYSMVELATTMGNITLQLESKKAPVSVENFLDYVESSYYDSTIVHRVVVDFVIQGGQYTSDLTKQVPNDTIVCESNNGLSNVRGTIAVARGVSPNSGTSQFFINLKDNLFLDRISDDLPGYAVFGRVIKGMDVVDAITDVPTSTQQTPEGESLYDVPVTPVIVLSARLVR